MDEIMIEIMDVLHEDYISLVPTVGVNRRSSPLIAFIRAWNAPNCWRRAILQRTHHLFRFFGFSFFFSSSWATIYNAFHSGSALSFCGREMTLTSSFAVPTKSHRLVCRNVVRGSRLSSTCSLVTNVMMSSNLKVVPGFVIPISFQILQSRRYNCEPLLNAHLNVYSTVHCHNWSISFHRATEVWSCCSCQL